MAKKRKDTIPEAEVITDKTVAEEAPNADEVPLATPNTVKVLAMQSYSNGMIGVEVCNWRAGETREIPRWMLQRIQADLPGNWIVL